MEWQYCDDCDFNDEDEAALIELEKQAKITLAENLTAHSQQKQDRVCEVLCSHA